MQIFEVYLHTIMFKRIVVPVDFSDTAMNAVNYAARMGSESGAELLLFHAVQAAIPDPYVPAYYITDVSNEQAGAAKESMDKLVKRLKADYALPVSSEIAIGDISGSLADYANREKADLVVMGTHGARHWLEKLMGTNTGNVVYHLGMPLLVVPEGSVWKGFKHLLCASDFSGSESNIAEALLEFAERHQPDITFLHVKQAGETVSTFNKEQLENYVNRNLNMAFIEKEGQHVVETLRETALERNADVIVIQARHHNWAWRIFNKSMSRELADTSEVPVLIIH